MAWQIGPPPKPGPGPSWSEWKGGLCDVAETVEIRHYVTGTALWSAIREAQRRADIMFRLERELGS